MTASPLFVRDRNDLVELVLTAHTQHQALELLGYGSKRGFGAPVDGAVQVAMTAFSAIDLYEPDELVLTAGANAPMILIQETLAKANQHLAFDPPDLTGFYGQPSGGHSLAGAIACNLAGPRRLTAGAARDHLLGFCAVSGRGEVFKAGGRVVKNVTGYDLSKLMAGSFGTLAALTECSVKVLPKPETEATLVLTGLDDSSAIERLTQALSSPNDVSCAAHLPEAVAGLFDFPQAATLIRLEGFGVSVAARLRALTLLLGGGISLEGQTSHSLWQALRDVQPLAKRPELLVWRISTPPAEGAAKMAQLKRGGVEIGWYDWAGGLLWLGLAPGEEDGGAARVRAALAGASGHATLMRAPEAIRRAVPVFQPLAPGAAALARRIKHSFDPLGVFNPGRMG